MEMSKEAGSGLARGSSPKDEELIDTHMLEQKTHWDGRLLINYGGFWYDQPFLRSILSSKKYFRAKDTDIIIASMPKSGTTWLKALTFAIANRNLYPISQTPLLTSNPHDLVPSLEMAVYVEEDNPDLQHIPDPRLFSTHRSFDHLPDSVFESKCKLIYICRNPLDQFISYQYFSLENNLVEDAKPLSMEEAFDDFCSGIHPFGPIFDQILGYWNAHVKNPDKVLFLKYEDLKEDTVLHVKKIAQFIGVPFSEEEDNNGIAEQVSRLCSFDNLKDLEVNKTQAVHNIKFSSYFRKGIVGDWRNHLTPEMAERLIKLMENKLERSGLMLMTN